MGRRNTAERRPWFTARGVAAETVGCRMYCGVCKVGNESRNESARQGVLGRIHKRGMHEAC
jgi:uncharacterized Fe-S cluster-containing radical SAM superfamily protein